MRSAVDLNMTSGNSQSPPATSRSPWETLGALASGWKVLETHDHVDAPITSRVPESATVTRLVLQQVEMWLGYLHH